MSSPFPETTFGIVCRIREDTPSATTSRAALETLCQRYWNPVHGYVRAALADNEEDAKDLTQEFFAWILESEVLRRYAPERGSFRNFLKGVLRNFERNRAQAGRRLKRGGGGRAVSLDETGSPVAAALASTRELDPAVAFDRAWLNEVTTRAVSQLREKWQKGKHALRWSVFEAYDLSPDTTKPTYASIATKLGVSENDVRNNLFAARESLRTEIRSELRDTVADSRALDEEWQALVGA